MIGSTGVRVSMLSMQALHKLMRARIFSQRDLIAFIMRSAFDISA